MHKVGGITETLQNSQFFPGVKLPDFSKLKVSGTSWFTQYLEKKKKDYEVKLRAGFSR